MVLSCLKNEISLFQILVLFVVDFLFLFDILLYPNLLVLFRSEVCLVLLILSNYLRIGLLMYTGKILFSLLLMLSIQFHILHYLQYPIVRHETVDWIVCWIISKCKFRQLHLQRFVLELLRNCEYPLFSIMYFLSLIIIL